MSTLIMWHNRLSENENEAVERYIHDIEIPRPKNRGPRDLGLKHHDIEKRRQLSHDIEIPRPKSHDIEFPWNSDPCAP